MRDRVWHECQNLLVERTRAAGEFVQNLINMEVPNCPGRFPRSLNKAEGCFIRNRTGE